MNKLDAFLVRMQRYTGVDNRYFIKGGLWVFSDYLVSTGLSVLLMILFARLVPKEIYGGYQFVLAVVVVCGLLSLPGLSKSMVRSVARNNDGTFLRAVREKLRWSVLGSLAIMTVGLYSLFFRSSDMFICLLIAAVFFPFTAFGLAESFFIGKKLFRLRTVYSLTRKIVFTAAVILALFFTERLFIIVLAYFAANTLFDFITYLNAKRLVKNDRHDKTAIPYGKQLSVMNFIGTVSDYIDQLVVSFFLGFGSLAVFSMASIMTFQVKTVAQYFNQYLIFPRLSELKDKDLKRIILRKATFIFLGSTVLIAVLILLTPLIVRTLLGAQYEESILYAQVLFCSHLFAFPASIFLSYLEVKASVRSIYILNFVAGIAKILLSLIFVYFFQLWGLVLSLVLFRYVYFLCCAYLFWKSD